MPEGVTRFREQLQQQQITVLERHGTGDIAETIGVEAITRHNDLIVLGATERGVMHKAIHGNPAADIMRQPPCNTILFRSAR
jgi:nucleotide-binding universal stress UspA family protein